MMLDARITGMSQFLQLTLFQSLLPLISDCPREFTLSVEIRVRAPPRSHHVVRDKMVNPRTPGETQELKTTIRWKDST